ncbi:MAG: NUDIX hydrolase [Pirellulaceae bacterium]
MTPAEHILLTTPRFRVEIAERIAPDGSTRRREVIRHPGAVTIIPMVDDEHVCLIRNFRVTVARTLIELPAGTLEPAETPTETAQRELVEETGYRAARWQPLHEFLLSPGILDEKMHLFLATELTAGEAQREPGEEIENLVVPWHTAIDWVMRREIEDGKTIASLLFYDALRRLGPR